MFAKRKTLAAVVLSATMVTCAGLAISHAEWNEVIPVHAQTMQSAIAEEQKAEVKGLTVTQTTPATVDLSQVEAGQYCLTVTITANEGTSQDYFEMFATINGVTQTLSMSAAENEDNVFYGVIEVSDGVEDLNILQLSTTTPNTLTVDVSVDTLFVSAGNGYNLSHVNLRGATNIAIQDSDVLSYTVTVDIGNQSLPEGATLTGEINNSNLNLRRDTSITYTNIYSGTVTISAAESKTLSIVLSSGELEDVTISVLELSNVHAMGDKVTETVTDVGVWETVIFSYEATDSKYITATATTNNRLVAASVSVGTTAGTFTGTSVSGPDYPVHVEKGTTYYFEVLVTPLETETESVTLTFSIGDWVNPTVQVNNAYSLPVTPAGVDIVSSTLDVAAGTYSISLADVPYEYYDRGIVITVHLNSQNIILDSMNGYASTVDITPADTAIYLTTSDTAIGAVTLSISVPEVRNYIDLGTATQITVPAKEGEAKYGSAIYYLRVSETENIDTGFYNVVLSAAGDVEVYAGTTSLYPVVPQGERTGIFEIRYTEDYYTMEFRNYGTEEATFDATVTKATDVELQFDQTNSITVGADQRVSYFVVNLGAGEYTLHFTGLTAEELSNLTFTVDGEIVGITSSAGNTAIATVTISQEQDSNGIVNFSFKNKGAAEIDFDLEFSPENVLVLGEIEEITVTGYYYYTAYYVDLNKGDYAVNLSLPDGMDVTVSANGEEVVRYGGVSGILHTDYDGYVLLRFNCNTYGTDTTFSVAVDELSGSITPGAETAVSIKANSLGATYSLGNLNAGLYTVELSGADVSNVKVAVNGLILVGNTFEITYSQQTTSITFIGDSAADINFTVTVSLTDSYYLALNTAKSVTLPGYGYREYFIDLTPGEYSITLSVAGAEIYVNGATVISNGDTTGTFMVLQSGLVSIFMTNYESADPITFTATVSAVPDDGTITLGTSKVITLAADESKDYTINLEAGNYVVTLTYADGATRTVNVVVSGFIDVIYDGNLTGTFEMAESGEDILTFTNTSATESVAVIVTITAA